MPGNSAGGAPAGPSPIAGSGGPGWPDDVAESSRFALTCAQEPPAWSPMQPSGIAPNPAICMPLPHAPTVNRRADLPM